MEDAPDAFKDRLLDAALPHVPFDGWSEATFRAAVTDTGADMAEARALCPRGAVDLALAYHRRGDEAMRKRIRAAKVEDMRFRDRVAAAVRLRIEAITDKEAVRRGSALFALPQHAADGAKAIWGTADAIWEALGDASDDYNWSPSARRCRPSTAPPSCSGWATKAPRTATPGPSSTGGSRT
jgi:ubiquinone biosynthesis protein COQ9